MILLKHKSIHWYFWVFSLSVTFILTLPVLIQDGMFMDGTLYAAVSHNLANGIGTFWFPSFSYNNVAGISSSFHEQPPLVFGIQALFFKILGSSMYVERLYVFVCLLLNIYLIKKLWEMLFKNDKQTQKLSWLPVLFWISIPVCFWSFSNNMHENTVSIFILLSIIFLLRSIEQNQTVGANLILSGICIFLASFSKGLPGLFPIAVPLIFIYKGQIPIMRALSYTFTLLLIVAFIYTLLLFSSQAQESLYNYFVLRLLKRVNDVPTTTNFLYILLRLLMESGIMIALALIIKLSTRKIVFKETDLNTKAFTFILIGCLGILPLMLTLVQKGFYMVPALPFIAIGFAIYISPQINYLVTKLYSSKLRSVFSLFFISLAITSITLPILNIGKTSRDKEKLEDIHQIGKLISKKSVINCSPKLLSDWSMQTYLARYYFISLDINSKHKVYLCSKEEFNAKQAEFNEHNKPTIIKLLNYSLITY